MRREFKFRVWVAWILFLLPVLLCGSINGVIGAFPISVNPKSDGYIGLPLEPSHKFAGRVLEVYGSNIRTNGFNIQLEEECFVRVRSRDTILDINFYLNLLIYRSSNEI